MDGDVVVNMINHFYNEIIALPCYNPRSRKLSIYCYDALCMAQPCHILQFDLWKPTIRQQFQVKKLKETNKYKKKKSSKIKRRRENNTYFKLVVPNNACNCKVRTETAEGYETEEKQPEECLQWKNRGTHFTLSVRVWGNWSCFLSSVCVVQAFGCVYIFKGDEGRVCVVVYINNEFDINMA